MFSIRAWLALALVLWGGSAANQDLTGLTPPDHKETAMTDRSYGITNATPNGRWTFTRQSAAGRMTRTEARAEAERLNLKQDECLRACGPGWRISTGGRNR